MKRELAQLFIRERKRQSHENEIQILWIRFLVDYSNQKFYSAIAKMREMFDKRVREIDYFQDVVKSISEKADYFRFIKIFRM